VEDVPHGAGCDLVAEADQFAVDAPVSPGRVLGGQAQHQLADLLADRWLAGQRREHDPVGGLQRRAVYLPAEHGDLVAQHEEFDVRGAVVAGELGQHLQHLARQQVHQRHAHDGQRDSTGSSASDKAARQPSHAGL
jgi:hypothetical protein